MKTDIWSLLDTSCPLPSDNVKTLNKSKQSNPIVTTAQENINPQPKFSDLTTVVDKGSESLKINPLKVIESDTGENGSVSFQDLISDISSQQRQKEVSLPFYFICLLHLANEKVCIHEFVYDHSLKLYNDRILLINRILRLKE